MRILNVKTYQFAEYFEPNIPPYAILSHRWEDDEVLFADVGVGDWTSKAGFAKIRLACKQASDEGLDFVWIDTCNIDKRSSAELSEAINSMFRWYRDAATCYAFLSDVHAMEQSGWNEELARSEWFRRGWTLQELVAPSQVIFFGADWQRVGTRATLAKRISEITGIHLAVLAENRGPLEQVLGSYPVATRLSWAASRRTTRIEDRAYSLLGLFGVNMPLLYGEGPRAFTRLQEEILKISDDLSILAWNYRQPGPQYSESLLAFDPDDFKDCKDLTFAVVRDGTVIYKNVAITNAGLTLENSLLTVPPGSTKNPTLGLGCRRITDVTTVLALKLDGLKTSKDKTKVEGSPSFNVAGTPAEGRLTWVKTTTPKPHAPTITISRINQRPETLCPRHTHVWVEAELFGVPLTYKMHPEKLWKKENLTFDLQSLNLTATSPQLHGALAIIDMENRGFTLRITHFLTHVRGVLNSSIVVQVSPYNASEFPPDRGVYTSNEVDTITFSVDGHALQMGADELYMPGVRIAHLKLVIYPQPRSDWTGGGSFLRKIRSSKSEQSADNGQYLLLQRHTRVEDAGQLLESTKVDT